jgi:hypothetical protein
MNQEFSDDDQQVALTQVLSKYKSTKGEADRRRETSKANMAKARAAKLEALRKKKEVESNQIEIGDSDDDSDFSEDSESDYEDIVLKKKPAQKGRGRQAPVDEDTIAQLVQQQLAQLLSQKGGKKKKAAAKKPTVRKKTVIQLNTPAAAAAPAANPHVDAMKRSILNF